MSFIKIGSTEDVTGASRDMVTNASTLIGDIVVLRICVDGGSITPTVDVDFTEMTGNLRHTGDTLGKQSWWLVADANGETTYTISGLNSSVKVTQTVYRNTIGGGTWALDSIVTSNTLTGGSFTMSGVTSVNDSLLLFSSSHDNNSAVTTPPPGMTEAAPNPTGGDTIGLRSYFEDITSGAAESQTIVYTGTDAILGDLAVFTYTIAGGESITADSGSYSYTGAAAGLLLSALLSGDTEVYNYTGTAAGLNLGKSIATDTAQYTYTGTAAALTFAGVGNFTLTADADSYIYNGTAGDIFFGVVLAANTDQYAYTGTAATLTHNLNLAADTAQYTYTGTVAALQSGRIMISESGSYIITGAAVTLDFSGNIWTDEPNAITTWTAEADKITTWTDQASASTVWTVI